MLRIAEFANSWEPLEIYWLAGSLQGVDGDWRVRAVTRGMSSGTLKSWPLSIGLLPVLVPGRLVVGGDMLAFQGRGLISRVVIPNVAECEEIAAEVIPSALYRLGGQMDGQRLFSYRVQGRTLLIPAVELFRALFVHCKTLALTMMVPGGLLELYRSEEVGFHENLHLRFTAQMPVRVLSKAFAAEFSWLAVHPDGRRAWDSVVEESEGQEYITFRPPSLLNSEWVFRGLRLGDIWLVLELRQITGKHFPCRRLFYSHPSIRETVTVPRPSSERDRKNGHHEGDSKIANTDFLLAATGRAKGDVHQRAMVGPSWNSAFEEQVEIRRLWSEDFRRQRAEGERSAPAEAPSRPGKATARQTVEATVAQSAPGWGSLPPVEFRLLEPAGWDRLGELKPLVQVIEMLVERIPDTDIAMSLCLVKPGRAFSLVGRDRRACLVAVFRSTGRSPVVLLDVDHSGARALSTLLLRYRLPLELMEVEADIKLVLDALVEGGGHWDAYAERLVSSRAVCQRLCRVLRQEGRQEEVGYLQAWVERLKERVMGTHDPAGDQP